MNKNGSDNFKSPYSWSKDKFDSEVLGLEVAKIESIEKSSKIFSLLQELRSNKIEYATYRVLANNFEMIHNLERNDFILVDGLISLIREGLGEDFTTDNSIDTFKKEERNQLIRLAGRVFFLNRLYNDPFIPKKKANKFYAKWMENSLIGNIADGVLVFRENGKVFGFVTVKKDGHIPLLGVSEEKRGRGIAKRLVRGAVNRLCEWNLNKAYIETQMSNIAALHVYKDLGFKIINSYLTFAWHNND